MPKGARRNTIVSHGGRVGTGRTHLAGRAIAPGQQEHLPEHLLVQVRAGTHGSLPAGAQKRPPAKVQTSAEAAAAKARAAKPVVVKATKAHAKAAPKPVAAPKPPPPAPTPKPKPKPVEEPAAPVVEADPLADEPATPVEEELTLPTTKRQLMRMSKANAHALAIELGLDVPDDPSETTLKKLQAALARSIGIDL